jgi:short-subunit dehydrogenase
MSLMPRPVALITGPTSGIGAGYARRYASDGYDLVPVARDVDRLTKLAAELQGQAGSIETLPADLADPAGRDKVAERLVAGVRVLVNNAGFGTSRVHAVCPGFVHTEFHARAGIEMAKLPSFLWLEVDDIVSKSLADIAGKVISVPGLQYKALVAAGRMMPRGLTRAATRRAGGRRGRS